MPTAPKPDSDAQMSPSWYAKQLGWAWPHHSGRTWDALLNMAERRYWAARDERRAA